MQLPPVDQYRLPLVEALGTVVLHAAWFENALIEFIAMLLPFGPETTTEQVAHRLRNWDLLFLLDSIERAIADRELAVDLAAFVSRADEVRARRHRVIHDAVEVGIEEHADGGYRTILMTEGYVKQVGKKASDRSLNRTTVLDIAQLAWEFYNLRIEIDTFLGRLHSRARPSTST